MIKVVKAVGPTMEYIDAILHGLVKDKFVTFDDNGVKKETKGYKVTYLNTVVPKTGVKLQKYANDMSNMIQDNTVYLIPLGTKGYYKSEAYYDCENKDTKGYYYIDDTASFNKEPISCYSYGVLFNHIRNRQSMMLPMSARIFDGTGKEIGKFGVRIAKLEDKPLEGTRPMYEFALMYRK